MPLKQKRPLYGKIVSGPGPESVGTEIWRRSGGADPCLPRGDSVAESKASGLVYRLLDSARAVVRELESGKTYYGGISIAASVVAIDTSKLATDSLVAGARYYIVAFEPASPNVLVEIPFRAPLPVTALRGPRANAAKSAAGPSRRNVLGRRVEAMPGARRSPTPLVPENRAGRAGAE